MKWSIMVLLGCLAVAAVSSCAKDYEGMSLFLAVNNTTIGLDTAAGSTHIMVYSTGEWNVSFKEKTDWAVLNKEKGSGNSDFVLSYTANTGGPRSTTIIVSRDTTVKTIRINQKGQ